MNTISKLIEQKVIPFIDTLLKKYKEIGLNEVETVILCKLYYMSEEDANKLDIERLSNEMTLSVSDLSNYVISLMERGYVNLVVTDTKEEYNLLGTMDKLGSILSTEEVKEPDKKESISLICEYLESVFHRVVNANDLLFINKWLDEKRSIDEIKTAILKTSGQHKTSINYVDAILRSKVEREKVEVEDDPELKKLLDSVYVKKR